MKQEMNPDKELLPPVPIVTPGCLTDLNILDQMPVAVFICDLAGKILRYNEQAARIWGRRPGIAHHPEFFSGAHRQYSSEGLLIEPGNSPVAQFLQHEDSSYDGEMIIERPDSSRVMVKLEIKLLSGSEGFPVGII
ncbi:MAG: PAS domain-containing protein, partial [Flavitalea sp.]